VSVLSIVLASELRITTTTTLLQEYNILATGVLQD